MRFIWKYLVFWVSWLLTFWPMRRNTKSTKTQIKVSERMGFKLSDCFGEGSPCWFLLYSHLGSVLPDWAIFETSAIKKSTKVAKMIGNSLGQLNKPHSYVSTAAFTFWSLLGNIGLIFTPTSGYTARNIQQQQFEQASSCLYLYGKMFWPPPSFGCQHFF